MKDITKLCQELETVVQDAYENGVTLTEAEKLAAKMLGAQIAIARALENTDLDARMRKNGVKAIKAAVYMDELTKHEKKPAEGFLEHAVNLNKMVADEQTAYDTADARKDALFTYLGIFKDAHIYFRGVAKGAFNG